MRRALVAAGLLFPEPREEAAFVEGFVTSRAAQTRIAMLLGASIYYAFSAWDWMLDPVAFQITHLIRLAVVVSALLPLTIATLGRDRNLEWLQLLYAAIPSAALPAIYSRLDGGFAHGAAGIVIVILFVSALLPMRILFFTTFCCVIWASAALTEGVRGPGDPGQFVVNQLYYLTAVGLALFAAFRRERSARHQFRTAAALRRAKMTADEALSDLQVARENLVRSEKLAALGQLVSGLAHEINTPVGNALTTATTLERHVRALGGTIASGRIARSDLTRAVDQLGHGTDLIRRDLARTVDLIGTFKQLAPDGQDDERQPIDLASWLDEMARGVGGSVREQGHTIRIAADARLAVDTAPRRLEQILRHLFDNAIRHAFAPGVAGTITIGVARDGQTVRLSVADDGKGIADEDLPKIFDPFFTTARERGGSGLGLHIVHTTVSALGGTIGVESAVGRGTRFTISLPASPRVEDPAARDGAAPPSRRSAAPAAQ